MKTIKIYRNKIPEHYVHEFSITIHSKNSERHGIEYDLICVLYDAVNSHPQFKNVKIVDMRKS